jgi:hypothetical protein
MLLEISIHVEKREREFDLPLLPIKKKLLAIKCPNEHDAERKKGRNQIGSMAWIQRTVA